MDRVLKNWLFQQCQMLPGTIQGQVLTGLRGGDTFESSICWPDTETSPSDFSRVVQAALRSNQAVIKTRNNALDETGEPLDALACPLVVNGHLIGVVAIEMTHRTRPMQEAAVGQVQAGVKWLESMFQLTSSVAKEELATLIELVVASLESERLTVAVAEIANELANRFECHRVSLGFCLLRRIRIEAISGSTRIDQHANLVQALRNAMHEAVDQGEALVYPQSDENKVLVTRMHDQLANQQEGTCVCTIPLVKDGKAVGALLLERHNDKEFSTETVELCQQVGLLLGPVLEMRRRDEQAVWAKVWDSFIGYLGKLFGPRHLSLKVGVVSILLVSTWLCLASSVYHISCESVLEAEACRAVVAPQNGYIASASARAGDLVNEGDILATLEDKELLLEQRRLKGQRAQIQKEYRRALSLFDRSEIAILNAKRAQAEAELSLIGRQLERTAMVAPFSGLLVKGDLSQALGSPVERGEVLFEVAPTEKYRVVLEVDDRDISLVSPKQKGRMKLSGIPNQTIGIVVDRLTPVSTAGEGRNYFRVEANMESQSDLMRPGMEGITHIEIGRKRLIWILTRRFVEWLRLFVWSWLP